MVRRKVCVIGLGYIGLPTAALLANRGYQVHGVDIVQSTVDIINRGEIHIVEPGLDTFVHAAVNSGRLKADIVPIEADIFIISVPTPFHENHVPNIDYVASATEAIIPFIKDGNIIILESTSPVGTTDRIEAYLKKNNVDTSKIFIAHCPERVLPGSIMKELVGNDRIIGGTTPESTSKVIDFYKTFVGGEIFPTDARTAEMAKLTENSFRDVNIAFANELSMLCDKFDINVWDLIKLTNRHPRVNVLQPGAGVGGHCIAVDPWFLIHAAEGEARIIQKAREVNLYKTKWVIEKVKSKALQFESENGRKAIIACMGLAFKANIDDLRESPALQITRELMAEGFDIMAVEPNIQSFHEFEIVNHKVAYQEADIITILVAHKEFADLIVNETMDFCGVLS
ncbi:UDP-N-acetyl-D-mannosamine dehydrogenase [bacterium]|nr:UDP-N-acetyl-D-mannosamine dehydrogenase [bacterium]